MRIIAITGGIGSGKSTVAGWIEETGVPVVDADAISRALTAPGGGALPLIRAAFGDVVFHLDGSLNRAALADLIFRDEPARQQQLNAILHPMVIEAMRRRLDALKALGEPVAVIEVPLLYEAGMEGMADTVICVAASEETRLKRLTARSGLTREQALARMRAQQDVGKTEALSDYVLHTDCPTTQNKRNALRLWQRIAGKPEA
jgi:dephospho-CoA kinase